MGGKVPIQSLLVQHQSRLKTKKTAGTCFTQTATPILLCFFLVHSARKEPRRPTGAYATVRKLLPLQDRTNSLWTRAIFTSASRYF